MYCMEDGILVCGSQPLAWRPNECRHLLLYVQGRTCAASSGWLSGNPLFPPPSYLRKDTSPGSRTLTLALFPPDPHLGPRRARFQTPLHQLRPAHVQPQEREPAHHRPAGGRLFGRRVLRPAAKAGARDVARGGDPETSGQRRGRRFARVWKGAFSAARVDGRGGGVAGGGAHLQVGYRFGLALSVVEARVFLEPRRRLMLSASLFGQNRCISNLDPTWSTISHIFSLFSRSCCIRAF